jgi:hypothetical protein
VRKLARRTLAIEPLKSGRNLLAWPARASRAIECAFQFLQACYLGAYILEMLEGNVLDRSGAHSRSSIGKLQEPANFIEGEVQLPATPDEGEALHVVNMIASVSALCT